jgi:hypothetical protein
MLTPAAIAMTAAAKQITTSTMKIALRFVLVIDR